MPMPPPRAGVNPFSQALHADPWGVLCAIYNFLSDTGYAFTAGNHHGQPMWILSKVHDDHSLEPVLWVPHIIPGREIDMRSVGGVKPDKPIAIS